MDAVVKLIRKIVEPRDGLIGFHYTNVNTLGLILRKSSDQENASFRLRFSRIGCLNDTSEGHIAMTLLRQIFASKQNKYASLKNFDIETDELVSKAKYKSNPMVDAFLWGMPFLCCFSKDGDSLPMWNYYSKGGCSSGCNIGFDLSSLVKTLNKNYDNACFILGDVVYDEAHQRKLLERVLEKICGLQCEDVIKCRILRVIVTYYDALFKRTCFKHENEVRLVMYCCSNELSQGGESIKLDYRENSGFYIPYFDVSCSVLSVVKSLEMGPLRVNREDDWLVQRSVLCEMFKDYSLSEVSVTRSCLPIRF